MPACQKSHVHRSIKMPPKKKPLAVSAAAEAEELSEMVNKLSSLHSWIKAQTLIRPTKMGKSGFGGEGGFDDDGDDEEFVTISLSSRNPTVGAGAVRWSHELGEYVNMPFTEEMIVHLEIESTVIAAGNPEGQAQIKKLGLPIGWPNEDEDDKKAREDLLEKYRPRIMMTAQEIEDEKIEKPKLQNKFAFIDRATQTKLFDQMSVESQTEQPPVAVFSSTVSPHVLYDFYISNESAREEAEKAAEARKMAEELAGPGKEVPVEDVKQTDKKGVKEEEEASGNNVEDIESKMLLSAKILERMVNLDTYDDVAKDYRFYEDPGDEFRALSDGVSSPACPSPRSSSRCGASTWRRWRAWR